MKAVILAAGRGTRMQPISNIIPKEMLPAYDKPVIRLILDELVESGATEVAVVTSADKPQLGHYLAGEGVRCIRQSVIGGTGRSRAGGIPERVCEKRTFGSVLRG